MSDFIAVLAGALLPPMAAAQTAPAPTTSSIPAENLDATLGRYQADPQVQHADLPVERPIPFAARHATSMQHDAHVGDDSGVIHRTVSATAARSARGSVISHSDGDSVQGTIPVFAMTHRDCR